MKSGSRDEPGTRLHAEQQFREGEIQVLVATEAAGEGINLQVCNILFNYDIPWNPNRLEQRMGRIHRYGQRKDCLIFNFVATNTIEGRVLQRLLEKLQEIRDALEDDAVFNVVGELLPATHIERVLRDYYAGRLGDADLEERLLAQRRRAPIPRHLPERAGRPRQQEAQSRNADRTARASARATRRAGDDRPLPARGCRVRADDPQTCARACRTPSSRPARHQFFASMRRSPTGSCRLLRIAIRAAQPTARPPRRKSWSGLRQAIRCSRRSAGTRTPRRWTFSGRAPRFYSLQHEQPARIDFYRARVVDGLGQIIHERLFAVEIAENGAPRLQEPGVLGNFAPADPPADAPTVAAVPEATGWLQEQALSPFLDEARKDRLSEIDRVSNHVELSLTELLQRADEEIGRAASDVDQKLPGAEGRLAQAETRHADLLARRDRRRIDLERQRALTLQAVERLASVLVLPHPDRESPEVRRLKPNFETEAIAMRVVMDHETALGRQVFDVSAKNLGYDITSLDLASGELRLIEVKGLGASSGTVLLTPNERRVAEDRRDCYWLYVVTDCDSIARLQEPVRDPARLEWNEVTKVAHYSLSVNAMTRPMELREDAAPYESGS